MALTAIENSVIPRVELSMKSTNASSGRSVVGNVLEFDQRHFSGNFVGLQMTASSKINSRTDCNRIDETRGKITVEKGDLLVNEKNIDRQTYTRHRNLSKRLRNKATRITFSWVAALWRVFLVVLNELGGKDAEQLEKLSLLLVDFNFFDCSWL